MLDCLHNADKERVVGSMSIINLFIAQTQQVLALLLTSVTTQLYLLKILIKDDRLPKCLAIEAPACTVPPCRYTSKLRFTPILINTPGNTKHFIIYRNLALLEN